MISLDRPASPEEVAAISAAIAALLAEEAAVRPGPALEPNPWQVAARIESLGLVRRVPGRLDLRYLGAPTRERLTRPLRQG